MGLCQWHYSVDPWLGDFAVCKIYAEVGSCLHHHRLTPGHGMDSATGDELKENNFLTKK